MNEKEESRYAIQEEMEKIREIYLENYTCFGGKGYMTDKDYAEAMQNIRKMATISAW